MLRRASARRSRWRRSIAGGLWNTLIDPGADRERACSTSPSTRVMPWRRGKLTIEAGNASWTKHYVRAASGRRPGQYVMIAVTDTGTGMTPEMVETVFEPFFTTKPEGQGTGLGLVMVYGFVKQSGGHIKIYSEPGRARRSGSICRARASAKTLADIDAGAGGGGTETVLVVEDDEEVRDTVVACSPIWVTACSRPRDAQSALASSRAECRSICCSPTWSCPARMRSTELARKARERIPPHRRAVHIGLYAERHRPWRPARRRRRAVEQAIHPRSASTEAAPRNPQRAATGGWTHRYSCSGGSDRGHTHPCDIEPRSLRVLLVEDDAMIRMSTTDMLATLGHKVEEAASAHGALELLENGTFDVLLTDVGLPGMSGSELADQAIKKVPHLRVIFATGYDRVDSRAGNAVLLRKPYTENDLAAAMDAAMR